MEKLTSFELYQQTRVKPICKINEDRKDYLDHTSIGCVFTDDTYFLYFRLEKRLFDILRRVCGN